MVVAFRSGSPMARLGDYDLVVGADGIDSTVLALTLSSAAPGDLGAMNSRSVAPIRPAGLTALQMHVGDGCIFELVPMGAGRTYGFAYVVQPRFRGPLQGPFDHLRKLCEIRFARIPITSLVALAAIALVTRSAMAQTAKKNAPLLEKRVLSLEAARKMMTATEAERHKWRGVIAHCTTVSRNQRICISTASTFHPSETVTMSSYISSLGRISATTSRSCRSTLVFSNDLAVDIAMQVRMEPVKCRIIAKTLSPCTSV